METITKESLMKEIAEQLTNNQSLEIENGYYYVYYLHIDENGEIKKDHLNSNDDTLACCAGSFEEYSDPQDLYEKETLDDEDFKAICENLAEQYVKEYLEEA